MVAERLSRKFSTLMVMAELNYRHVQAKGVEAKVDLLYRSTLNDNSEVRGWRDEYFAEIVPLDNGVLFQLPQIVKLGLTNEVQLLAYFKQVLISRLTAAKDLKTEYANELCGVIEEQIAAVDAGQVTHAVLGGIHRGMGMDRVIARWKHDAKTPYEVDVPGTSEKKLYQLEYTDEIPCEIYNPTSLGDLVESAHRRNGEGSQQVKLTMLDFAWLADMVIRVMYQTQTFFRHFALLGAKNLTPAEVEEARKSGGLKDAGGKMGLAYNIASMNIRFPKLRLLSRMSIDPETATEEEKKDYIDIDRIIQGSLKATTVDPLRNLAVFRVCAAEDTMKDYYAGSNRAEHPLAGTEALAIESGARGYWTDAEQEAWWANHCPYRFTGQVMPTTEKKVTTVNVEQLATISKMNSHDIVKGFADSLLAKDGKDSTVVDFLQKNDARLGVANKFFLLASDPMTAGLLTELGSALEAIKDKDPTAFRRALDDTKDLYTTAISVLTAPATTEAEAAPTEGGRQKVSKKR